MVLIDTPLETNTMQATDVMVRKVFIDEVTKLPTVTLEPTPVEEKPKSFSPIKIPLVSSQPVLASSPKYILTNECTRRKNQFVVFDEDSERWNIRSFVDGTVLAALWHDNAQRFLILTQTSIFTLDPETKQMELQRDLIPTESRVFKTFTLSNEQDLFIAYDQWGAQSIDQWRYNKNNSLWELMKNPPINLTSDEFMTDMSFNHDSSQLALTIYDELLDKWRIEFRETDTMSDID